MLDEKELQFQFKPQIQIKTVNLNQFEYRVHKEQPEIEKKKNSLNFFLDIASLFILHSNSDGTFSVRNVIFCQKFSSNNYVRCGK